MLFFSFKFVWSLFGFVAWSEKGHIEDDWSSDKENGNGKQWIVEILAELLEWKWNSCVENHSYFNGKM